METPVSTKGITVEEIFFNGNFKRRAVHKLAYHSMLIDAIKMKLCRCALPCICLAAAGPSWRGAPVRLVTGAVACAGAIARCHGAVPREAGRGCRCQSCHRQRSSSVGGHHRCGATEKRCTAVGASTPQVPGASAAWRQAHCVLLASPTPLCWRGNSGLRHVPLRSCQQASARQRQSKNLRESTRETPAHACRKKKACVLERVTHVCARARHDYRPNLELIV